MPSSSASSSGSSDVTAVEELAHSPTLGTGVYHDYAALRSILTFPLHIPRLLVNYAAFVLYLIYQLIVKLLFAPAVSKPPKPFGRIAIIGAGLSGVASAAHAKAHGFDVVLYDTKSDVGGIWLDENATSGLQLNSVLYRFFPTIIWRNTFPKKAEIVRNVRKIWEEYDLQSCTRFNTKVEKVHRHSGFSTDPRKAGHGRWVINNGEDGIFDAVIACVGTTGDPKMINLEGRDNFGGQIVHSSQLDDLEMDGKDVIVLGSGASGVEAAELAVKKGAKSVKVLAHSDKWIIPRNLIIDIALALNPLGRETPFSFIWEYLLRIFHYRELAHLSPVDKGIFEGTPVVNDNFLHNIRHGKTEYFRGDVIRLEKDGVRFYERKRGEKTPRDGKEKMERESSIIEGQIFIFATGYTRPSVDFLPQDLFPQTPDYDFHRPNLYLQNFSVEDWSILLTNSSYRDAVGTVGNWHIGIYTRILLTFLLDPSTRPMPKDMQTWVRCIEFLKRNAPGGSLTFFTYSELIAWCLLWHVFRISRIKWLPFSLFGWKGHLRHNAKKQSDAKEA